MLPTLHTKLQKLYDEKISPKISVDEISRWTKIAHRVTSLAVHLRGNPGPITYLGLGVSAIDAFMEIREDRKTRDWSPYSYFDTPRWRRFPFGLVKVAFRHLAEVKTIVKSKDTGAHKLFEGRLGGELVSWYGMGSEKDEPLQICYLAAREKETLNALADVIWEDFKTDQITWGTSGFVEQALDDSNIIDTKFILDIEDRCKKFVTANESRGVLLSGSPGAGKSSAARRVAKKLGFRTVHVELAAIMQQAGYIVDASILMALAIVKPDVVIIDDIDRLPKEAQVKLLALLEQARKLAKIVFVSVNDKKQLMDGNNKTYESPLLRPGGLDDHFTAPDLEEVIVRQIVGDEDTDLFPRLVKLPIAYVREFAKRKSILGREKAREEFASLEARGLSSVDDPEIDIDLENGEEGF